jgi:hypothetical protein
MTRERRCGLTPELSWRPMTHRVDALVEAVQAPAGHASMDHRRSDSRGSELMSVDAAALRVGDLCDSLVSGAADRQKIPQTEDSHEVWAIACV